MKLRLSIYAILSISILSTIINAPAPAQAVDTWVAPVSDEIVSGFRGDRPNHQGVDLGSERGTRILAASAGTIMVNTCNASLGGAPYSCDTDGSPSVSGCGWYVDIRHAGNIVTRYCHLVGQSPFPVGASVSTGQVIGLVGNSGNSSGPHLHFETHMGVLPGNYASPSTAVDPVPFMRARGAPLETGVDAPPSHVGPSAADFDGDDKTDYAVWQPASGEWSVRLATGVVAPGVAFGIAGDVPVAGDYDGDGKVDRAVFRPSEGQWYVSASGGVAIPNTVYGTTGDVPVPGDYDGDGRSDWAVWRPSNGEWYVKYATGAVAPNQPFGITGDIPVPGDYDGDGRTDRAVFRPSQGQWYVLASSGLAVPNTVFGTTGDVPVPGDYDGDGRNDWAVWRPSNGEWYVKHATGALAPNQPFGITGDIPVAGDYDGDARTDRAVFRPSENQWYVLASSGAPVPNTVHGSTGSIPVNRPITV